AFPGICHTCVDLACMATHRPARSAIAPPVTAIGLARPRRPLALRQTLLERVRPGRGAPGTIAGPGPDALSDTEALRARTVRRTRQASRIAGRMKTGGPRCFCGAAPPIVL